MGIWWIGSVFVIWREGLVSGSGVCCLVFRDLLLWFCGLGLRFLEVTDGFAA